MNAFRVWFWVGLDIFLFNKFGVFFQGEGGQKLKASKLSVTANLTRKTKIAKRLPEDILSYRLHQHQNRIVVCNVREFSSRIPTIISTYISCMKLLSPIRVTKNKVNVRIYLSH